jgi:hypothetical protein
MPPADSCAEKRCSPARRQPKGDRAMIQAWSVTHQGMIRKENQDSFRLLLSRDTPPVGVVCDGMGGNVGGLEAGQIAAETFLHTLMPLLHENLEAEERSVLIQQAVSPGKPRDIAAREGATGARGYGHHPLWRPFSSGTAPPRSPTSATAAPTTSRRTASHALRATTPSWRTWSPGGISPPSRRVPIRRKI